MNLERAVMQGESRTDHHQLESNASCAKVYIRVNEGQDRLEAPSLFAARSVNRSRLILKPG